MDNTNIHHSAERPTASYSLPDVFALIGAICFLAIVSRVPDNFQFGNGVLLKAYAVLLVVYAIRIRLRFIEPQPKHPGRLFVLALALLLPFVYSSTSLLAVPLQLPIHKWFGDPIWLFLIPACSYYFFEFSNHGRTTPFPWIVIVWLLELLIFFPLWTTCWAFLELVIADMFVA